LNQLELRTLRKTAFELGYNTAKTTGIEKRAFDPITLAAVMGLGVAGAPMLQRWAKPLTQAMKESKLAKDNFKLMHGWSGGDPNKLPNADKLMQAMHKMRLELIGKGVDSKKLDTLEGLTNAATKNIGGGGFANNLANLAKENPYATAGTALGAGYLLGR